MKEKIMELMKKLGYVYNGKKEGTEIMNFEHYDTASVYDFNPLEQKWEEFLKEIESGKIQMFLENEKKMLAMFE